MVTNAAGPARRPVAEDPDRLRRAARAAESLLVDGWTAEVVTALDRAGIESLLLKGPTVSRWLHPGEVGVRGYTDVDLLVAPADLSRAGSVLAALGFACDLSLSVVVPGERARHAEAWRRPGDGAVVDLHRSIHSTEHLDPAVVWSVLTRGAGPMVVGGVEVAAPAPAVRALHVVLHVRPKDDPGTQPWADLERAVAVLPPDVWVGAHDVAAELGVTDEMGALLRLVPGGEALADELGLPRGAPAYLVREHERSNWPTAEQFLANLRPLDRRRALAVLARKVVPTPDFVRAGWPVARRGRLGLAAAYVWRLLLVPVRALEWYRFRRGRAAAPGEPRRPGLRHAAADPGPPSSR